VAKVLAKVIDAHRRFDVNERDNVEGVLETVLDQSAGRPDTINALLPMAPPELL